MGNSQRRAIWLTGGRGWACLVEVGGSELPGAAGEVDVVRVVHLAQVVEAARLPHTCTISDMQASYLACCMLSK